MYVYLRQTSFLFLTHTKIIRTPLIMFPLVLASTSDAAVAIGRISDFLTSEELAEQYKIDYTHDAAVHVDGDFTWETGHRPDNGEDNFVKGRDGTGGDVTKTPTEQITEVEKRRKKLKEPLLPTTASNKKDDDATAKEEMGAAVEKPFALKNLNLRVSRGLFVAIVGRVGSGKVS
jgi:ABC-type multidrug transport system fused ATPase/permease subunit